MQFASRNPFDTQPGSPLDGYLRRKVSASLGVEAVRIDETARSRKVEVSGGTAEEERGKISGKKSEGRATGAMGFCFGSDTIQEKRRKVGGRRGREGVCCAQGSLAQRSSSHRYLAARSYDQAGSLPPGVLPFPPAAGPCSGKPECSP